MNVTCVIVFVLSRTTLHSQYSSWTSRLASARSHRWTSELEVILMMRGNAVQLMAARMASPAVSVLVRL